MNAYNCPGDNDAICLLAGRGAAFLFAPELRVSVPGQGGAITIATSTRERAAESMGETTDRAGITTIITTTKTRVELDQGREHSSAEQLGPCWVQHSAEELQGR